MNVILIELIVVVEKLICDVLKGTVIALTSKLLLQLIVANFKKNYLWIHRQIH